MPYDMNDPFCPYRYEMLKPHEVKRVLREAPLGFLPVGTLEWHGPQNIVGLDAIKAHMLCLRTAQRIGKATVFPPSYAFGLGSMHRYEYGPDFISSIKIQRETGLALMHDWFRAIEVAGFRALIVFCGHGPVVKMAQHLAEWYNEWKGMEVYACGEGSVTGKPVSDHAGRNETSYMMELVPGSVEMERASNPQEDAAYDHEIMRGVSKSWPQSSPERGAEITELVVSSLAGVAEELLGRCRDTKDMGHYQRD